MATFHLTDAGGATYEVDAPDEHTAIAALGQMSAPKNDSSAPATPAGSAPIGAGDDLAKTAIPSLGRMVAGTGGLLGDVTDLGAKGIEKASNYISDKLGIDRYQRPQGGSILDNIPTSASLQKPIEAFTGNYQPQTEPGKIFDTAIQFAPAVIGGPEAIAAKLATRVAAPALASEGVGKLTEGSVLQPYAKFAAALAAGAGTGAAFNAAAKSFQAAPGISRGALPPLLDAMQADGPAAVRSQLDRLGPNATLADAGPAFLGKAQGASLNSDEARTVLQRDLKQRDIETNSRIASDVHSALGPAEDPQTVTNAIRAHRTEVDNRNYPTALENAPDVSTAPILRQLDNMIPQAVGMEKKALQNLHEMMMTTEKRPLLDTEGFPQYDKLGHQKFEDVPVSQNDAGVLHKVKQELDNVIQYDAPGLGVPAGALSRQQGTLKLMRGQLNNALERQVPGYAQANTASAALAKRADAVEAGTQYLGSGKTTPSPARFESEFAPLSQGEKIAFAKGSRGNIDRLLGTKANDLQALRGELQGEGGWNTAKLGTVHGDDAAAQLIDSVDRNLKFRDTYGKVVENSQTAQRTAAQKAMKPDASTETPLINPNMTMAGLPATIAKKTIAAIFNAALKMDKTKSFGEVARILAAQGAQRDAYHMALVSALSRRQSMAGAQPISAQRALILADPSLRSEQQGRQQIGQSNAN